MINATNTLPSATTQMPKDATFGAKPVDLKPKKKINWKALLGVTVLVLVLVGGAAGFYLSQQTGVGDTRQQAAEPTSFCASGSGICPSGYTQVFDSTCANQVRCNSTAPGDSCIGECINTTSCLSSNRNTASGVCTGTGQKCCAKIPYAITCSGSCQNASQCSDLKLGIASGSCNPNQVCCGGPLPTCFDRNQGCIQVQTLECNGGVGSNKFTSLAACQQTSCDPSQVINHTCPTGEEAYCNNGTVACRAVTVVNTPVVLQGCNQDCYSSVSCSCPVGCANSTTTLGQTCGGNTTPALTTCDQQCNSQAGCSCPTSCDLSFAQNGLTCTRATTVTPTPGTGGTGLMCPNPPHLPAKKWVKFTCDKCQYTTEAGVAAWRCYDKRQDSSTPLTLGPDECGQVDVLSGDTDASYCGYINDPTGYSCDQARCHPEPSPNPSTPPVESSCANLEVLDPITLAPVAKSSVVAGQEYRYRCVPGAGVPADYYFFTARSTTTGPLNLIYQGISDLTFPIMTTDYLHVQCNPCVGTSCASAQNVNSSCNFEYTKTVTPGPQCLALWMASSSNPTVSLTNPHVGDKIFLGCGQVTGAARYIFRVTEPDGTVVNLGPLDATAAPTTSQEYAITKQGRHYAQCQICTGQADSTCFAYETLPASQN